MGVAAAGGSINRQFAWVLPYELDWTVCPGVVTILRATTSVLRWYDRPELRQRMLAEVVDYIGPDAAAVAGQLRLNWDDLLDSSTLVGPIYQAAPFARFLESLGDGDLVEGGPTPRAQPAVLARVRPGYAYLLGKWQAQFPDRQPPWPFWIFPRSRLVVAP